MAGVLVQYLREGAAKPFSTPDCDCTSWVADWVLLQTGKDPMAFWRGKYTTRFGYLRLLRREPDGLAGAAHQGLLSSGAVMIDPAEAQPGDVGLVVGLGSGRNVESFMAIRGNLCWIVKSAAGLVRCPEAIRAWRI